jgi:hypothetical protein
MGVCDDGLVIEEEKASTNLGFPSHPDATPVYEKPKRSSCRREREIYTVVERVSGMVE